VAFDAAAGHIVVADLDSHQVHVLRADDGSGVRSFGTTLGLGSPWGVAVNHATGHILATIDNHRVHVWRADDRSLVRTLGSRDSGPGQFLAPCGVAVDKESQHVFVADSKNHRVHVWRADDGSFLRVFGSPGSGPAQFQLG
jgi:tripartite motif-containing protein 2/3/tripartite motif-containing protein 71